MPGKPVLFGKVAFTPNAQDEDGISLYREWMLSPVELDASRRKPGYFFIARLLVRDIRALALTIRPSLCELPGHVVIPELNTKALADNKRRVNEFAAELAKLASQDIVFWPYA